MTTTSYEQAVIREDIGRLHDKIDGLQSEFEDGLDDLTKKITALVAEFRADFGKSLADVRKDADAIKQRVEEQG